MKIFESMRIAARNFRSSEDLNIEAQGEQLERRLVRENAQQEKQIREQFPTGFFKLVRHDGSFIELRHWCPECKTLALSPGPVVKHYGCVEHRGRIDKRPETFLRVLFLPELKSYSA